MAPAWLLSGLSYVHEVFVAVSPQTCATLTLHQSEMHLQRCRAEACSELAGQAVEPGTGTHASTQQATRASLVQQASPTSLLLQRKAPTVHKGTEHATGATLEATTASADMCSLCRIMLGTSQPLKQSGRHARLADCAESYQGALPSPSASRCWMPRVLKQLQALLPMCPSMCGCLQITQHPLGLLLAKGPQALLQSLTSLSRPACRCQQGGCKC